MCWVKINIKKVGTYLNDAVNKYICMYSCIYVCIHNPSLHKFYLLYTKKVHVLQIKYIISYIFKKIYLLNLGPWNIYKSNTFIFVLGHKANLH